MTQQTRTQARLAVCALAAAALSGFGCSDSPGGPDPDYTVGGTVSGLVGSGCVLQLNGANNFSLTGNGAFTFPGTLTQGASYLASVLTDPLGPNQTCTLINASGNITGANITNLGVTCTVDSPACTDFLDLGSLSGDVGTGVLTDSYTGSFWDRVQLTEDNNGDVYLSATITLTVPPGIDYDLYLYCGACAGGAVASSTLGAGSTEVVRARWDDDFGQVDDGVILIEVRYFGGSSPTPWTLRIDANTAVTNATCDF